MKKLIITLLLLAAMLFTACESSPSLTPEASASPEGSLAPSATQTVPPTSAPTSTPDKITDVDGVFNVSQKKYDYKGNNVMILNVENVSNKAYSIQITADYKNESGTVIKSQTESFEGFAAKWSNYFVFNPEISFAEFDFEISMTEYKDEVLADKIHIEAPVRISVMTLTSDGFIKGKVAIAKATQKDLKDGSIEFDLAAYVTSKKPISFWMYAVLFDANDEIITITQDRYFYQTGIANVGTDKDNLSWKSISLDPDVDISNVEMLKTATSIGSVISIDKDK